MRKYIVLLFLLIISNILNSQSINTYDESKPIISTGNNPTFNVSNYLYDNEDYLKTINEIAVLDSLIQKDSFFLRSGIKDKLDEKYIALFKQNILDNENKKISLLKKSKKIEEDVIKTFEKSETLAIVRKDDSLYIALTKKYPFGFKIFVYGDYSKTHVKNIFEPESNTEFDFKNLNIIFDEKENKVIVKIYKWKIKSNNIDISDLTETFSIPISGYSYKLNGIVFKEFPNPHFEILRNQPNQKIIVIGFK